MKNVCLTWVLAVAAFAGNRDLQDAPLSIVHADNAPVRLESASLEGGSATGLRVRFVITNLRKQQIDGLVVTAATVNTAQKVTSTGMQVVQDQIEGRATIEQFVVFPGLVPAPGERVVFGIQAVAWSSGPEWRGVLRLVPKKTAED